jgi:pyruvate dehydrogenase E1 component alpha subunit
MRKKYTKQELIDFENRIGDLYLDNKLPFLFHLSGGNEEQLIEIFEDIQEGDWVISNHRSHYHALLHGISEEVVEDRILNGRSMFIYDKSRNFFCSAIIGGTPGIAVGIALGLKRKGSKNKVWCFIGDGTEDSGHTFESARYVDGFDLPCTFVIENNNRSVESTNEERWGKTSHLDWSFNCVKKYSYEITYPHARKPGMIDLSKCPKKTDEDYFPYLKPKEIPNFDELNHLENLSYKDAVTNSMTDLGQRGAIFIGYNVARGDAMGTLKNVPNEQKIETPVAENLMAGMAIGLSFLGFLPVIYFERHDFMLVAADAIGNHIDKIERISHGEFKVPLIIRAVTADGGPFYSGPTHQQDFTKVFRELVSFPVIDPQNGLEVLKAYNSFEYLNGPLMVIERKSKF